MRRLSAVGQYRPIAHCLFRQSDLRGRIGAVREIGISADDLVSALLASGEPVCILDSCGVGYTGSHLLIAGVRPAESVDVSMEDPEETLRLLDKKLSGDNPSIFTLSYGFGAKIQNIGTRSKRAQAEPDVFIATFDALIVHDYETHRTFVKDKYGNPSGTEQLLAGRFKESFRTCPVITAVSNFSRSDYLAAVETIKEYIREGETYQTNLTQQIHARLPSSITPELVFWRLRRDHPAAFAAFIRRSDSTVVSASPERFISVEREKIRDPARLIRTSPIKGTRRRGRNRQEDREYREELIASAKDRAENTMIVDLLRNDLGRVCEFGSVRVEALCELEEHPTLFHLVSTVSGKLRQNIRFSDILRATFPCGSITGAPKIRTMQIIDEIETAERGLSMGAIGCYLPNGFGISDSIFELNVAIRTMVIREQEAVFNVGGGITIDSSAEQEYEESLLKAKALLAAMNAKLKLND